jgi:hypothetical protein
MLNQTHEVFGIQRQQQQRVEQGAEQSFSSVVDSAILIPPNLVVE